MGQTPPASRTNRILNGSPPRLWGRQHVIMLHQKITRFTPTPVGQTFLHPFSFIVVTVHPHACGADFLASIFVHRRNGSPPRLWGRRCPFCACSCSHSVHPHACGADAPASRTNRIPNGSPPRLWGRQYDIIIIGGTYRFTPTPVGQTD